MNINVKTKRQRRILGSNEGFKDQHMYKLMVQHFEMFVTKLLVDFLKVLAGSFGVWLDGVRIWSPVGWTYCSNMENILLMYNLFDFFAILTIYVMY